MSARHASLCAKLKQLGFTRENQMRLYGAEFRFLSDRVVLADGTVFVDAIEKHSRQPSRILIPLPSVNMADTESKAA